MLTRRTLIGLLAASAAARASGAQDDTAATDTFSETWLRDEAQRLASEDFVPRPQVPEAWRDMTREEYQALWFDGQTAEWEGTERPYRIDFFAPGLWFDRPVEVNVIEDDTVRNVPFDLGRFRHTDAFPDLPVDETLGYSGFRLRSEIRESDVFEEFCVFQGPSYFRAIGTGQTYGLSARGLATKTAGQGGEEFPDFTRFWIVAPRPEDSWIRIYALLDGATVTGAYRFDITPGTPARMRVRASLFAREEVANVGIAPLTSMFFFDETNRARFDDFRSSVHDSEGLLMLTGSGERIWRPLANPRLLQVSAFLDRDPKGFGLMQRSREVAEYGDLAARYENRPSLWVTPGEGWGPGTVNLIEIPSDRDIYDNIVAYWRPAEPLEPGTEHVVSYDLDWGGEPAHPVDLAPVLDTRIGKGSDPEAPGTLIAIDFGPHPALQDPDRLNFAASASRGTLSPGVLRRNPGTGGVRLSFRFEPGETELSEMRALLLRDEQTVSETWLYRWTK